jgi:MFS family permease
MFVVSRILQGFQLAFVGSLVMALASDSLPKSKIGSGIGMLGAGGAIATAIAPSFGLFLRAWGAETFGFEKAGYTAIFLVSALAMLVAILPCALFRYTPPSKETRSAIGVWYKNIVAVEAIIPGVVILCLSCAYILYTFFMEPFAAENSIAGIGAFFTAFALVMVFSRPICGRLTDQYGVARVLYPSLLVFILSFVIISAAKSLPALIAGAMVAAAGYGTALPAMQAACMKAVPPLRSGVAGNTIYFGIDMGMFLGPTIGGIVASNLGYANMYLLCGTIPLVLSGILFFLYQRLRRNYTLKN